MSYRLPRFLLVIFSLIFFTKNLSAARIVDKNPIKEDWSCEAVNNQWVCHRAKKPKNVFNSELKTAQRQKTLADDLSWVRKPSYYIGGYYSNDSQFTKQLCKSKELKINFQDSKYLSSSTIIASGNVEFLECDQELYGDDAIFSLNNDGESVKSLEIFNDAIMRQPSTGIIIRTTDLDANLDDETYSTGRAYFRMAEEMPDTRIYDKKHFSGYIRGYAKEIKKEDDNNIILKNAYLTTGDPYDNAWKIGGENLDINVESKTFYVKNGFFYIKDIPVMYVPYMSFFFGKERKSGFLVPSYVQNDNAGFGVAIPYYFNLAPNYDLLLETVLWSQRGLMENGTFRYMNNYMRTQLEGSLVPYDFKAKKIRGAFTISTDTDFKNGIRSSLKYDYVSDAEYYNDFSEGNISLVTKTLLDREFDLYYSNSNVDAGLTLLKYGVVNPRLTVSNTPYAKLPEVKLNLKSDGYTPDYINFGLQTLNTFFYKQSGPATDSPNAPQATNVNTFRAYEAPKVTVNLSSTWGYFKPSLEIPIRYYMLDRKPTDVIKFSQSNVTSVLPIFNIDGGLYFDKEYASDGIKYVSELHPRIFYTYIPYQDQTNIPLFDTSFQNEQYMQMFQVNRFTGHDRINNANQISYALEASTKNQIDGSVLASAKIGQMAYFADRKVTLCQGDSKCTDQDLFAKDDFSPVMSSFEYQVSKKINLSAQINYRVDQNNFDYQVYQLSYKDDSENIFNISYNNIASDWNSLTQQQINDGEKPPHQRTITLSTMLNLADQWSVAALWNYNFEQKKVSDVFVGFQYDAKSWAVRALWQGTAYTNTDPNLPQALDKLTNTFSLSFELKGLGGSGASSNVASRLSQINGFENQWGAL